MKILSVTGTEDRGFESRQGVRFLGFYTLQSGLPDFSRHNIPIKGGNTPNYLNINKWPLIYQMAVKYYILIALKYTNSFHPKALHNLPNFRILV
jgi:hypothetical protein